MNIKNIFNYKKNVERLKRKAKQRPLPKHVAIIMDGNGRWAKQKGLAREMGHRQGSESLKDIVEISGELGIGYLTLFAFSTENWQRPQREIDALMDLLVEYLESELEQLDRNNIQINMLGDLEAFPDYVQREVINALERTEDNTGMRLNIALNYGGRDDIIKAVKDIIGDIDLGALTVEDLDEEKFANYLYTSGMPDPDLLIRTSGEYRISNFLLYQMAYTELWFSKPNVLWPDFNQRDFLKAILDYQGRQRKFGGLV